MNYLRKNSIFLLLALLLATGLAGCATTKELAWPPAKPLTELIKPGESIRVETKDGKNYRFRVQEVRQDELVGRLRTIKIADIQKIDIVQSRPQRAAGAGLGGFTIFMYGIMILALIGILGI